jgi:hypothetical protein
VNLLLNEYVVIKAEPMAIFVCMVLSRAVSHNRVVFEENVFTHLDKITRVNGCAKLSLTATSVIGSPKGLLPVDAKDSSVL